MMLMVGLTPPGGQEGALGSKQAELAASGVEGGRGRVAMTRPKVIRTKDGTRLDCYANEFAPHNEASVRELWMGYLINLKLFDDALGDFVVPHEPSSSNY